MTRFSSRRHFQFHGLAVQNRHFINRGTKYDTPTSLPGRVTQPSVADAASLWVPRPFGYAGQALALFARAGVTNACSKYFLRWQRTSHLAMFLSNDLRTNQLRARRCVVCRWTCQIPGYRQHSIPVLRKVREGRSTHFPVMPIVKSWATRRRLPAYSRERCPAFRH
jgi:hypothetical protein